MRFFNSKPESIPSPSDALPGRSEPIMTPGIHTVLGTPLAGPWPEGTKTAIFGLGCFWGDEKDFWQLPGVVTTAVGYAGGYTPNPTYQEVCSSRTGHAEVVLVAYDPTRISYEQLLKTFWEAHDPTQGMRQGNDHGHAATARSSSSPTTSSGPPPRPRRRCTRSACRPRATARSRPRSRIAPDYPFYYAEDYHQQYLDKNPRGYCPNHSTGVKLPDDFVVTPLQYVD